MPQRGTLEAIKGQRRRWIERRKQLIRDAKNVPCMDCGVLYHACVMDFDHRDPSSKLATVSLLAYRGSLEQFENEITKCDVVCSNCHRMRTYNKQAYNGHVVRKTQYVRHGKSDWERYSNKT